MRKRGEVLRERAAEGGQPAGSLAGIAFYACPSCGVRQSVEAGRGGCIRCGADMQMGAQAPEAKGDGDPWALKPETQAAKVETKAPEPETKAPTGETTSPKPSAESRTLPLPLGETTPAAVQAKSTQPLGADEMTFGDIVEGLRKLGKAVSMVDVARWTPQVRRDVVAFIIAQGNVMYAPEVVGRLGSIDSVTLKPAVEFKGTTVDDANAALERAIDRAAKEVQPRRELNPGTVTVTVTWGKEVITPIPGSYSTVEVGPFSISVEVPASAGLTREVFDRLNAELATLAEAERIRKVESFVKALRGVVAEAKAAGKP